MKNEWTKKLLALALSLVVAVTFIPLLGDSVFAEGEDEGEGVADVPAAEEVVGDDNENPPDAPNGEENADKEKDTDVTGGTDATDDADEPEAVDEDNMSADNADEVDDALLSDSSDAEYETKATILAAFEVSIVKPKKVMHVYAKFNKNIYVAAIFVDNDNSNPIAAYQNGQWFSDDLDISFFNQCSTHTITLKYKETSTSTLYKKDRELIVPLYDKPSSKGSIEVYHNYINYMAPVDYNLVNYKLNLQYSADGRTWYTVNKQFYALDTAKFGGLKPNTNYRLRTYYSYYNSSTGTTYTGDQSGNYLYLGTYRTGMGSTPKIKSIQVKAYKVKKKKQKVYGYYTGLYLGSRTYYSYKLKIIVKLKKKPGTNGIWINGKKYKGNKKKYTVKLGKFTSYYKPKGKKYTVALYTYVNNSYGGYSPMYTKVKKIK